LDESEVSCHFGKRNHPGTKKNDFLWRDRMEVIKNGKTPNALQVIVPAHGTKIVPIGTLKSIIDGSGLDVSDFQK